MPYYGLSALRKSETMTAGLHYQSRQSMGYTPMKNKRADPINGIGRIAPQPTTARAGGV